MEIEGSFYVTKCDAIEVQTVKGKSVKRLKIKTESGELSFSIWGKWDTEKMEYSTPALIETEIDETPKQPEPVNADPSSTD